MDLNGKPYNPKKAVIEWDGKKWVGDVPDGPWAPQADTKNGKLAYIMTTDGYAQLYGPGRLDGRSPSITNRRKRPWRSIPSPSS